MNHLRMKINIINVFNRKIIFKIMKIYITKFNLKNIIQKSIIIYQMKIQESRCIQRRAQQIKNRLNKIYRKLNQT